MMYGKIEYFEQQRKLVKTFTGLCIVFVVTGGTLDAAIKYKCGHKAAALL